MQITVQTFGAFRQFGRQIILELADDAIVSDVRQPLVNALVDYKAKFDIDGLVESSRFATETSILDEQHRLTENMLLTILPPVSGG